MKIELNRDQIKYIAVFTMLLNHVANIFLQPGTFACEALKDIGYFTAPVMCWFLVEGYRYTRSVKKYAGRLLIFAVISQLPYYLAFARNHLAPWYTLNMIFTLFLCLCLMIAEEKISDPGKKSLFSALWILSCPVKPKRIQWSQNCPVTDTAYCYNSQYNQTFLSRI